MIDYVTAITCTGPPPGTNTINIPANLAQGMSYLQSYTYSCMEGYNTTDELCTVCQPDGSLSLTVPPICAGNFF